MSQPGVHREAGVHTIKVLRPESVDQLRLGWWSRTDPASFARALARAPDMSVWVPETHEYALVAPWRHRSEVVHVIDLVAVRNPVELLRAAIERARAAGARLLLWIEMSERRSPAFYARAGLQLLETVISYEIAIGGSISAVRLSGQIKRVDTLGGGNLDDLIAVDWSAFPFLWRNSREEFQDYVSQPGVEAYLFRDEGAAVGYLGISTFPGWGHIDRLAIASGAQGRGRGRELTLFALERLASLGATRVGLSTQHRNRRSQNLYSKLGFHRQLGGDYRIYGCPLWQNDSIEDLVTGFGA
jgi:ribosomal protein S18 acetylase RimI-like enzyme